jgi:GNAT superfamily N-acetyltransferase
VIVRIAVQDDAAAIADVVVQSWQQGYRDLLPQAFLDSLDPERRVIGLRHSIRMQRPPAEACIVAAGGKQILGFAHISPTRDEAQPSPSVGEVVSLYVRPDAWGRGFGTRLLAHSAGLLRDAGNTEATLWVLQNNARATRCYEANGWSLDGATKQAMIADAPVAQVRYRTAL